MGDFGSEEAQDPIWKAVSEALEAMTADVPSGSLAAFEEIGIAGLRRQVVEHGAIKVIENCIEHNGREAYVFYYFAYAGIEEVVPYLEPYLDSDDLDEVMDAINGLIYFDRDRAYKQIQRFCDASHPDDSLWWFGTDLKRADTSPARSCLEKLRSKASSLRIGD